MHEPAPSDELWKQNGGDLQAAVDRLASAQRPSALLAIDVEWRSLAEARRAGLREREGMIFRQAWETALALLPPDTVGRRTLWSRFELVVEGTQATLGALGVRVLAAFESGGDLRMFKWHLVFTDVFLAEPERTFLCDPNCDLRSAGGKSVIVWVQPYAGVDWRAPQRYPTVEFLPLR